MIDKKIVYDINKLADLLQEIRANVDKYPNLVELGQAVLNERLEQLEQQIEEMKR
ncbi:MAG: hypothetical protein ACRCZ0_10020 [Cetobacterium sp.]